MVQTRERCKLFKFFYVLLSIITFPIYAVLFVFRHPAFTILFLLILAGGAAYYPISQGVEADKVIEWYTHKFSSFKKDVVAMANEKGMGSFVPKSLVEDVKKAEEDAKEAALPKGENYNAKVIRDTKAEDTKSMLKRRGGFKKKETPETEKKDDVPEVNAKVDEISLDEEIALDDDTESQEQIEEKKDDIVSDEKEPAEKEPTQTEESVVEEVIQEGPVEQISEPEAVVEETVIKAEEVTAEKEPAQTEESVVEEVIQEEPVEQISEPEVVVEETVVETSEPLEVNEKTEEKTESETEEISLEVD